MKYRFISDNSNSFSVVEMAAIFKIHRGSYYKWLKSTKRRTERQTKEVELLGEIKAIQEKSRYSFSIQFTSDNRLFSLFIRKACGETIFMQINSNKFLHGPSFIAF